MGTDNLTFGPGILYDGNGKPIGTGIMDGEQDTIPEIYNDDDSPAFTLRKPSSFECELEATCTSMNVSLLKELAGMTTKPQPFYMEFDGVRYEQIRKHKKRRINKKWAKRYGYREIPCRYRIENCYIRPEPFNDWSIVSDPAKIVRDI